MPISKDMARRYPADWAARRRFIIRYRAANRCEWCHAANGEPHPATGSQVVLTLAHVWDKAPENASLLNLAALCQRCHNRWDASDRRLSRIRRRLGQAAQVRTVAPAVATRRFDGHGTLPGAHRGRRAEAAGGSTGDTAFRLRVRGVNAHRRHR